MQPRAATSLGEVGGGMVLPLEDPLGGQQPLHSHRPAGVDPGSGDAHLGTKAKPETVRKPGAGVVEHTGAVHAAQELPGRRICEWKWKVGESVCGNLETAQIVALRHLEVWKCGRVAVRRGKVLNKINFPNDLNLLW